MGTHAKGLAVGIDIGGTGIKGAVVDLDRRCLHSERLRMPTPQPATPESVAHAVGEIANALHFRGPIGVDFPAVLVDGVVKTAANVDESWKQIRLSEVLGPHLPGPVQVLNDADAAGLAEMRFGAGHGHHGLVIVATFGTGIGTALFHHGQLIPNGELGHLQIDGHDAETRAGAHAKERDQLSWEAWTARASTYLQTLEDLLWPELIIVGGGIAKKPQKWLPHLETRTPVKVAELSNNAGIIGAALAGAEAATGHRGHARRSALVPA